MSARRIVPLLLVVLIVAAIVFVVRTSKPAPKRVPKSADPIEWTVHPPDDAPKGAALRIGRPPPPPVVRWKGSISFDQTASGRFGTETTIPNRLLSGTFTATEATDGPAPSKTVVDANFNLEETVQSAPTLSRAVHAVLTFSRGADGFIVHRSIRLEAPSDLHSDFEVFQFAWTQRFSVPDRAVRVGERLPIDECLELDDAFRRPLWFLFKERASKQGPVSEPVEGGAWIESMDDADGGSVRLRTALTHAHVGANGPTGSSAVTIDYRAVLDGDRTFGLADGSLRRHALTLARRISYTARDLDYAVVVRSRVSMEVDPTPR